MQRLATSGGTCFDPPLAAMPTLGRTLLANRFLSIVVVEPNYLPPFPIGGSLGEFEDLNAVWGPEPDGTKLGLAIGV